LELEKIEGLLDRMQNKNFDSLIHGFDTLQCAYFLESTKRKGINFELLERRQGNVGSETT